MKQTKVYVFGSFDGLHFGHKSFLRQAKQLGHLTVVVARDSNIVIRKGKKPKFTEEIRLQSITELRIADKVMLGQEGNKFDLLKTEPIDIICLGYDQFRDEEALKRLLNELSRTIKISRAKPFLPIIFKSSRLKRFRLIK